MKVKLTAKSTLVTFNVANKATSETLYDGKMEGKSAWSGKLPADGEYQIMVYSMSQGKDQRHTTPYRLNIAIK